MRRAVSLQKSRSPWIHALECRVSGTEDCLPKVVETVFGMLLGDHVVRVNHHSRYVI